MTDKERWHLADRLSKSLKLKDEREEMLFSMASSNFNEAIESFRHGNLQPALVMARSAIDAALFASRYPNGSSGVKGEDSWAELKDQAERLGFDEREVREIRRIRALGSVAVHAGSRYNEARKELMGLPEKERKEILAKRQTFTNEKGVGEELEKTAKYIVEIRKRTVDVLVEGEKGMGAGSGVRMSMRPEDHGKRENNDYIDALIGKSKTLKILSPVIDEHYARKLASAASGGANIHVITSPSSSLDILKPRRLRGLPFGVLGVILFFLWIPYGLFGNPEGWVFLSPAILLIVFAQYLHSRPEKEFPNLHVRVSRDIPSRVRLLIGEDEAVVFSGDLTNDAVSGGTEHLELVRNQRGLVRLSAQFNSLWKEVPEEQSIKITFNQNAMPRSGYRHYRNRRW